MKHAAKLGLSIVVSTLLAAAPAAAQDSIDEGAIEPAEAEAIDEPYEASGGFGVADRQDTLLPVGLGFSAGGGYVGFIDDEFNDMVDAGGGWEARVIVGTDTWVGFEAAYLGSINELDMLGVADDVSLVGHGATAALHLNLLPPYYDFRPYLLAGAGWTHYSVQNADENISPLRDSENVFSVPLGGGIFYDYDWLFTDIRVQFAPAVSGNLVSGPEGDETNMSTWRVVGNIGFEL